MEELKRRIECFDVKLLRFLNDPFDDRKIIKGGEGWKLEKALGRIDNKEVDASGGFLDPRFAVIGNDGMLRHGAADSGESTMEEEGRRLHSGVTYTGHTNTGGCCFGRTVVSWCPVYLGHGPRSGLSGGDS